jgi:hypothetical protein
MYSRCAGTVPVNAIGQLTALKNINLYGNTKLNFDHDALEHMLPNCVVAYDDHVTRGETMRRRWLFGACDGAMVPARGMRAVNLMQVVMITSTMALLEVNNPNLLAVFGTSVTIIVAWTIQEEVGIGGLASFLVFVAAFFFSTRHTMTRIEGMERCYKKYRVVDKAVIGSRIGKERGPENMALSASSSLSSWDLSSQRFDRKGSFGREVEHRSSFSRKSIIVRHAQTCLGLFDEKFVRRMAYEAVPGRVFRVVGPRVMSLNQLLQTADLEHGGDASNVNDVLSCQIVVTTLTELCSVWRVFEEIINSSDSASIIQVPSSATSYVGLGRHVSCVEYLRCVVCMARSKMVSVQMKHGIYTKDNIVSLP